MPAHFIQVRQREARALLAAVFRKAAVAHFAVPSEDANENPFTITLTGTGLYITQDTDGDGMNDVAEFNLSGLGFNWQPALVSTLASGAC